MARPKVSPLEKRSLKITFRVTEKQRQRLLTLADSCGTKPGDLVRTKIFKGHFPATRLPKIDEDTYVELKKIGVNLNQLTRHADSGKFPFGIDKTLAALLRQEEKILRLLLKDDSGSKER
ncbi:plasmid mobilization relaxosome protein MobC [Mucilaginibacter sp. ZT4R22]|uniref:Plasmid mobilization relaxosome protein MobC n=1 Tax=Mucilaginibacter pankratovii TaxID=2772110 RepID=A0ABR7WJZ7_9SPHI|nr:plasmid mobilization relaxosome protein MobC [Mucilaginibacter pankratovii]MBD1362630.1 plasmid mobilization relaxosome protein MobC [Mucilaginibacter pankratovii]